MKTKTMLIALHILAFVLIAVCVYLITQTDLLYLLFRFSPVFWYFFIFAIPLLLIISIFASHRTSTQHQLLWAASPTLLILFFIAIVWLSFFSEINVVVKNLIHPPEYVPRSLSPQELLEQQEHKAARDRSARLIPTLVRNYVIETSDERREYFLTIDQASNALVHVELRNDNMFEPDFTEVFGHPVGIINDKKLELFTEDDGKILYGEDYKLWTSPEGRSIYDDYDVTLSAEREIPGFESEKYLIH